MDDFTEELLECLLQFQAAFAALYIAWQYERSKRWLNRRWLVRPINKKRRLLGFYYTLVKELELDSDMFFRYTRMDLQTFNYLLKLVGPHLAKKRNRADIICPKQRLLIALRYLSTGDEILSISLAYRIGESTATSVIQEVCQVLYKVLSPIYLRAPCKQVWRNISKGFNDYWNLPNCCGAVDGKHIIIKAPPNSGSKFYNYKKSFSIVLLAACNHRYEFTLFDVGSYGSESDGGILSRSEFGAALEAGNLDLPTESAALPNTNTRTPYYFVGDEAFKMTPNFMRPYPGRYLSEEKRIFNYRLSRARRCIENAFGILVNRWRVFSKLIGSHPESVDRIVLACVCLHNFIMARTQKSVRNLYCSPEYVDTEDNDGSVVNGIWRQQLPNNIELDHLQNYTSERARSQEAYTMRDTLAQYFISPDGEVPWQREYVNRGRYRDS